MLTFFRRIRKGLLEGGATRKYLLYAIGEIALVVIGILIALQINNWNEGRKSILEGKRFIQQIHLDLVKEHQGIQNNIERFTSQNAGAYSLLKTIELHSDIYDGESFQKGIVAAYTPINVSREKLTWDDLISSGRVDIIRDDTLAQLLKSYYYSYDLDVITFNKAPSQALFEFQRLCLRNIDLATYDKTFDESSQGIFNQERIKQVVSQEDFGFLLREILVGSKVLMSNLQGKSLQIIEIIEYIEENYIIH